MSTEPTPDTLPTPRPRRKPGKMKFSLPEELFILSLDDDLGGIETSVRKALRFNLAGAILAELALTGKIRYGEAGHPAEGRLIVEDSTSTGNEILDTALSTIAAEEKPRKPGHWIDTLGQKQTIRQVAARLEERGVIHIEGKRLSRLLPYDVYPRREATAKYWVKRRLRALALVSGKITPADVALLSLLKACRLFKLVFTRDERKAAGKTVDALVQSEIFDAAVAQLLTDIEAAAVAAG
jgi:hypothetical protein